MKADPSTWLQLGRSMELTPLGLAATDPDRPNPLGRPVVVPCLACPRNPDGSARPVADCICWGDWTPGSAS